MWDARYSRDGYVYGTQPNDFLRENVTRLPKGRTLCIADGEGRNGCFLAGEGFDVLSVDQSAVGLAKARQLAEQLGVGIETRVCDMNDFDWSAASFASIVSIFAHMPLPVRRRVHRGVVEALQPGGVFLLEAYTPAQMVAAPVGRRRPS